MDGGFGRRLGLAAAVCSLLVCTTGCWPRARHGLVLRGDWSLELNRAPWLANRSESYQEASPDCVPTLQGTAAGVDCAPATGCGPVPPLQGPAPADQAACMLPGRPGPRLRCASSGQPTAAAAPAYYNHPRFHPVPNQPVFHRDDLAGPTGTSSSGRPSCGAQSGWTPKQLPLEGPSLKPKRLEVAERPPRPARRNLPPSEPASNSTRAARPALAATAKQTSWIFTPPDIRQIPPPESRGN